jgi:hypothetical protein
MNFRPGAQQHTASACVLNRYLPSREESMPARITQWGSRQVFECKVNEATPLSAWLTMAVDNDIAGLAELTTRSHDRSVLCTIISKIGREVEVAFLSDPGEYERLTDPQKLA